MLVTMITLANRALTNAALSVGTLVIIQAFSLVNLSSRDKEGLSEGSKLHVCVWCHL